METEIQPNTSDISNIASTKPQLGNFYGWALVALGIAFSFNYLFFSKLVGLSVFIFALLILGVLAAFARARQLSARPIWWLAPIFLFFAAMLTVRDNEFLIVLNILAAIGIFLLMIRAVTREKILNFSFLDYILTFVLWPLKFIGRAFRALGVLMMGGTTGATRGNSRKIVIGTLMALPVLLFFGALFSSADLAFRAFLNSVFTFTVPEVLVPQVIWLVLVFMGCLGWLAFMAYPEDKTSSDIKELLSLTKDKSEDRKVEMTVFLGLIAALFLLFLIFQINYLFGGAINITDSGFTYAEYARKGFWELLVVSIGTLLILASLDNYTSHITNRKNWLIIPSMVLIVEVLVIIVSAFKRLLLYQSAYGLTGPRLLVFGIIILLAVVFLIFTVKILLNKKHSFFAFGVLISVIVALVGFNLLNPDKFIVDHNVNTRHLAEEVDGLYLFTLSADAIPSLLENFEPQTEEERLAFEDFQSKKFDGLKETSKDWQSFNFSRHRALEQLQKR